MLRAWTPTVPVAWSTEAVVVVDEAAEAAVFRGVAIDGDRVYATDFHNGRVDVYDAHWRRIRRPGAFVDRSIPDWYAPFGIHAIGGHVFVTYVWRAPVNGNDAPTGGYVDEFDRDGRLLARVAHKGPMNAPWGLALAPRSFGRFGGDLLVGNFGDGHINAFRRRGDALGPRRRVAHARRADRRERPLGALVRKRRHGRSRGHALLHGGAARLARRHRARRARPARVDHSGVGIARRIRTIIEGVVLSTPQTGVEPHGGAAEEERRWKSEIPAGHTRSSRSRIRFRVRPPQSPSRLPRRLPRSPCPHNP